MKDFDKFLKANKEKLHSLARKNTEYNNNGDAVISRNDSWFYEDEWDEYYKQLVAREKNFSTGSVVR